MDKFNRNYILKIQTNDGGQIDIQPPFTVEFDITRNILSSANVASVKIYNLNQDNRERLHKNRIDFNNIRAILFLAGYESTLSVILSANVSQCFSVRRGVDFITELQCFDAGFAYANANFSREYPSETTKSSLINDVISQLKPFGVEKGIIGQIDGKISRGNSYSGNPIDVLSEITGGKFFIDNEKAYVLGDNECVNGSIFEISAETGLLGTPMVEETYVNLEMLFEPRIQVGQIISVKSATNRVLNQEYKVVSVRHSGIISESIAGQAKTSLGLFAGTEKLITVQGN